MQMRNADPAKASERRHFPHLSPSAPPESHSRRGAGPTQDSNRVAECILDTGFDPYLTGLAPNNRPSRRRSQYGASQLHFSDPVNVRPMMLRHRQETFQDAQARKMKGRAPTESLHDTTDNATVPTYDVPRKRSEDWKGAVRPPDGATRLPHTQSTLAVHDSMLTGSAPPEQPRSAVRQLPHSNKRIFFHSFDVRSDNQLDRKQLGEAYGPVGGDQDAEWKPAKRQGDFSRCQHDCETSRDQYTQHIDPYLTRPGQYHAGRNARRDQDDAFTIDAQGNVRHNRPETEEHEETNLANRALVYEDSYFTVLNQCPDDLAVPVPREDGGRSDLRTKFTGTLEPFGYEEGVGECHYPKPPVANLGPMETPDFNFPLPQPDRPEPVDATGRKANGEFPTVEELGGGAPSATDVSVGDEPQGPSADAQLAEPASMSEEQSEEPSVAEPPVQTTSRAPVVPREDTGPLSNDELPPDERVDRKPAMPMVASDAKEAARVESSFRRVMGDDVQPADVFDPTGELRNLGLRVDAHSSWADAKESYTAFMKSRIAPEALLHSGSLSEHMNTTHPGNMNDMDVYKARFQDDTPEARELRHRMNSLPHHDFLRRHEGCVEESMQQNKAFLKKGGGALCHAAYTDTSAVETNNTGDAKHTFAALARLRGEIDGAPAASSARAALSKSVDEQMDAYDADIAQLNAMIAGKPAEDAKTTPSAAAKTPKVSPGGYDHREALRRMTSEGGPPSPENKK